ncbi:hypothetical protein ABZ897_50685 [Nonomuraea sp. NPDC046802]|uniref:hypothetical protein n=1 Tax=Nonomuraea sp. NPDC046802 TaxID=3154919 RepID=UPI0033D32E30
MGTLRIISTAGDLAKAAASVPSTVPIILGASEIEPGADITDAAAWAVVAEDVMVPATAQGTIAGPDEPAAIVTELSAEGVTRRLAGVQVLLVRARLLAQPGRLGPDATPADAEVRRADAFQAPDGDMNRFLLELADVVSALREEIVEATQAEHQPFSPAAQRRLLHAVDALDGARLEIGDAVRFGDVCELARRAASSTTISPATSRIRPMSGCTCPTCTGAQTRPAASGMWQPSNTAYRARTGCKRHPLKRGPPRPRAVWTPLAFTTRR